MRVWVEWSRWIHVLIFVNFHSAAHCKLDLVCMYMYLFIILSIGTIMQKMYIDASGDRWPAPMRGHRIVMAAVYNYFEVRGG